MPKAAGWVWFMKCYIYISARARFGGRRGAVCRELRPSRGIRGSCFQFLQTLHQPPHRPPEKKGPKKRDLFKNLNLSWEVVDGFMCPHILPALKVASEKFADRNESMAAFFKKNERKK